MIEQEVADCFHPDLPHCGFRWLNSGPAGGSWTCTLDAGHDGYHAATGLSGEPVFDTEANNA
jgi:hypothetical protein